MRFPCYSNYINNAPESHMYTRTITRHAATSQEAHAMAAFERSQGHLPMVRQINGPNGRWEVIFTVRSATRYISSDPAQKR